MVICVGISVISRFINNSDLIPLHGGSGALFGFVGVSAEQRAYRGEAVLKEAALEQLCSMFGAPAASPRDLYYHDWAFDRYCASAEDRIQAVGRSYHPDVFDNDWGGRLLWAGTETALPGGYSNGYLEGAVESGNRAGALIIDEGKVR